jgi:glycosyltransferase involved in cell wall biosynthesis
MKIAQIVTRGDTLGGAQTHVRELSLQLRSMGHDITVITGAPGIFSEQMKQAGITCIPLPSMVRPLSPHRDLAAVVQLIRVLRELEPELVCTHTAKAGSLGRVAAWLQQIPSVFTPHGWSMLDRVSAQAHPFYRWTESLAARLGTCVINVCEFERECARQSGIGSKCKLEMVHNGISEISLERTRPVEEQPPTLVMVARYAPQKDHATLLEALSGIHGKEWTLVLVGSGQLEPYITAHIRRLRMESRVRFLPPETDVPRLLMTAQIFVLSTHFEAFPMSILEAMRAALPVVATRVGGIPEAVRHGHTGLLVAHRDVLGLRESLARLVAEPDVRVRLGAAGQQLWASRFTGATMTARTLEVYDRALAAHERRHPHYWAKRHSAGSRPLG